MKKTDSRFERLIPSMNQADIFSIKPYFLFQREENISSCFSKLISVIFVVIIILYSVLQFNISQNNYNYS